jgi:hypothetical protein
MLMIERRMGTTGPNNRNNDVRLRVQEQSMQGDSLICHSDSPSKMTSTSTDKPERPAYQVKIAKTRDEVEACLDIRVEGMSMSTGLSTGVRLTCSIPR